MSTAHRLLVTLQDSGFAERDTTGARYELGPRAYQLVHSLFQQFDIRRASLPTLKHLAELTGETAVLDVRVGWFAVRMAGVEGWREIHPGAMIGRTVPLAESVEGSAIFARLTEQDQERYRSWRGNDAAALWPTCTVEAPPVTGSHFVLDPARDGRHGTLSHVIVHESKPLASISLEGTGPLHVPNPPRELLAEVAGVVTELDRLVAANPDLANDPFAHVDPDLIQLMPTPDTAILGDPADVS